MVQAGVAGHERSGMLERIIGEQSFHGIVDPRPAPFLDLIFDVNVVI